MEIWSSQGGTRPMPHFWLVIGAILEIKLVHTLVHNLVQMAPHAF